MTPDDLVLTPRGVRFQGQLYPCTIGKTGITRNKREGDKATPAGIHRIVGMLYRPDRIPAPVPWAMPIGPRDLWSDDGTQGDYNSLVQAPYPHSHEVLRRADPLYDLVILTDWNWPDAVAGRGSAIFIHQQRRPGYPTEGCVAFSRAHLHQIAARLTRHSRLIV
ncbi:L,D-transpeptidase family protein [Sulfitobacter sp. TCYB15]|uniref:L,D-transpeptidase family protein n=1 Tax=Sulfitobacter sp. TCYB15 TaxID=3229275 RepID=A0AAU8C3P9_9RHOB|nr:L,D-transpeptidase family protein [Sulfitobacter pontiacus]QLL41152.1 L,D-transpeptidase family protein [Sulfitobacter pontiacus]